MDVLQRYRCLFRLQAGVLDVEAPAADRGGRELRMDSRGHVYVDVSWPGATAQACWDTGAGITIVNRGIWLAHRGLFEEIGTSAGTDATGATVETPVVLLAGAVIGGRWLGRPKAGAGALSHPDSTVALPTWLYPG